MTKLEQKLIELGYLPVSYRKYQKCYFEDFHIEIELTLNNKAKGKLRTNAFYWFYTQQDIDNLQQGYNEMQKDLAILKECEE